MHKVTDDVVKHKGLDTLSDRGEWKKGEVAQGKCLGEDKREGESLKGP